jgi:hypothetical protein
MASLDHIVLSCDAKTQAAAFAPEVSGLAFGGLKKL